MKRRYNMLVTVLEECTRDNLEFIKDKATKVRAGECGSRLGVCGAKRAGPTY